MAFDLFDITTWAWDKIIPAAAAGAATYYGASQSADANATAAGIAQQNRDANVKLLREAAEKANAYITPLLQQGQAIAAPGITRMTAAAAQDPYTLTPQQQIELNDRNLAAKRGIPLAFRGSGRATTAMINDTVNRGRAAMIDENQRRGDTAASNLASQGMSTVRTAVPALANVATGSASNIAAENTGAAQAAVSAETGTAASNNAALSSIASFFANQAKDDARESRYKAFTPGS